MTTKTIARIVKVNHAGEYGAIRIYQAQQAVARLFYPDLLSFFHETLEHENSHCRTFRSLMLPRNTRPCRTMWLWSVGGWALGAITSLLGRNAIMTCTYAVENTVHQHLEEQIRFLKGKDEELKNVILSIQKEELQHLAFAQARLKNTRLSGWINAIVTVATKTVIWLSTWGDSAVLQRELA